MPSQRIIVEAALEGVTVYSSRAQLEWKCPISLPAAGDYVVALADGVHQRADRTTLQVRARRAQGLLLRGIQFTSEQITRDERPRHRSLQEEQTTLERSLRVVDDDLACCARHREWLAQAQATVVQDKRNPVSPQVGGDFLSRFATAHTTLATRVRELKKNREEVQERIADVKKLLRELGDGVSVTTKDEIEVRLTATAAIEAELIVSYLVDNASWEAVYEANLNVVTKRLALTYYAVIKQSTAVNWVGVDLRLSSAKPSANGSPPEAPQWNVSLAPIVQFLSKRGGSEAKKSGWARSSSSRKAMREDSDEVEECAAPMMQMFSARNMFDGSLAGGAPPPPRTMVEEAAVSASITSATFAITGKSTIPCTGQSTRVVIMQRDLDIHPRYSAVPKLSPHTFLKVQVVNTTEYPFLAGEIKVFSGSSFIGSSSLDWVSCGEDAWLFLGVDDDVSVKRTSLHQRTSTKHGGLLSSKRQRIEYAYAFEVKHSKASVQEVVVWDQLPVSSDDQVKVTLVTPAAESQNPPFKVNELGMIEWFLNIAPGTVSKFDFVFVVDYPPEMIVAGL